MASKSNTAADLGRPLADAAPEAPQFVDRPQPRREEWPRADLPEGATRPELARRTLRRDELVLPSGAPELPLVIEPAPAAAETRLTDLLLRYRGEMRAALNDSGALLFRGFDLDGIEDFEAAMYALGLDPSREYPFGVSPRPNVAGTIHKSTEYANFMVIPPHTEMAYAHRRASWIAFLCDVPPERYGETPLFDMAMVLERLPDSIRERLVDGNMQYVRHIRDKKAIVTFERTIEETFGTRDRARIAEICDELGIEGEWLDDKFLKATTELPAVTTHPVTGRACLNAQFINAFALIEGIERIRDRYPTPLRLLFEWYIRKQFAKPTVHYKSQPATGPDFTSEEEKIIANTIYDCSTIFRWRRGDVLVIDNIRTAHGRLNVKGERRILTCLGDFYEIWPDGSTRHDRKQPPVPAGKA